MSTEMDISTIRLNVDSALTQRDPPPQDQLAERRDLIKAAAVINANQTFGANNELVFILDRTTHRAIMRVVDRKTKEVVMQLPPDYVLRLAEDARSGKSGGSHF